MESLNVGVAAGISIYELRMRMVLSMLTDRIRNTLGRELNLAGALARQALDARLRAVGELTSSQVVLLIVLACGQSTPLTQLRRDVGLDTGELDLALRPMVDLGNLAVDAEQATITRHGEQAIAALWAVLERVEEDRLAGFSAQEKNLLFALLRRIQDNAYQITAE